MREGSVAHDDAPEVVVRFAAVDGFVADVTMARAARIRSVLEVGAQRVAACRQCDPRVVAFFRVGDAEALTDGDERTLAALLADDDASGVVRLFVLVSELAEVALPPACELPEGIVAEDDGVLNAGPSAFRGSGAVVVPLSSSFSGGTQEMFVELVERFPPDDASLRLGVLHSGGRAFQGARDVAGRYVLHLRVRMHSNGETGTLALRDMYAHAAFAADDWVPFTTAGRVQFAVEFGDAVQLAPMRLRLSSTPPLADGLA